jgi:casein kinase II subunit beta
MVPFWKEALEMVLDVEPGTSTFTCPHILEFRKLTVPEEDSAKIPDVSIVESSAELLYGLVHQRFILTKVGLTAMVRPLFITGSDWC